MRKYINNVSWGAKVSKAGFTLLELLVVVLIVAILAAVLYPSYTVSIEKPRALEAMAVAKQLYEARERYVFRNGESTNANTIANLDIDFDNSQISNALGSLTVTIDSTKISVMRPSNRFGTYGFVIYNSGTNYGNMFCVGLTSKKGNRICNAVGAQTKSATNETVNSVSYEKYTF
ncbi:prepilin-type N-terminal cleavage/methylation domain-containing protein [Parelusimicrobium proximum]|uniref:prepilin-type N-terminal cleavage/methylation domain-containing protein n=1 Tax=Parelusimicrobium proximum TaxID=3228953 RepID=UPI003D174DDC